MKASGNGSRAAKNSMLSLAELPVICEDVREFVRRMKTEDVDVKQLGLAGRTKEQILNEIRELYTST